jgi:hypothetical protein
MKWEIAIVIVVASFTASAQGTFQDLDFESASIPSGTPKGSAFPVSEAFPGWTAFFITDTGTYSQQEVNYDAISLGGVTISIVDMNFPISAWGPYQGKYSAFLWGGGQPSPVPPVGLASAGLSQTAVVPAGTESLQFDAYVAGAPFVVTLGGQTIAMTLMQSFTHYGLYEGNIPSGMAGQTETLSFVEPPAIGTQPSEFEFDNISFSPNAVPEPSTLALAGLGGLLFALYRRLASQPSTKGGRRPAEGIL